MPLTPGLEYRIMFPAPFDGRLMTTQITDDPSVPPGHFKFELEVVESNDMFKVRIADDHTPCSYALCIDGQFQHRDKGAPPIQGVLPVQTTPDGRLVASDPIPVLTLDQWVTMEGAAPVILLYFTLIPDGTPVAIDDDGQPETAFSSDGYTPGGKEYVRAFPADVLLPKGVEEKKMSRKKVRVIIRDDR
ncbi:MAG: hypothetical protein C0600_08730 [Ignavibacteria bacterium]|nr:MAG: hypothetical protein C0600_08730 [Ignavibacteria bacterium]